MYVCIYRDGNGAGMGFVIPYLSCKNNSSTYSYPNSTGIKLLTHLHLHRIMDIISYTYPFSYYFNINFN